MCSLTSAPSKVLVARTGGQIVSQGSASTYGTDSVIKRKTCEEYDQVISKFKERMEMFGKRYCIMSSAGVGQWIDMIRLIEPVSRQQGSDQSDTPNMPPTSKSELRGIDEALRATKSGCFKLILQSTGFRTEVLKCCKRVI
ncbi:hypothetical protein RRG08_040745 [Elysia crispata]|uniref:Uncharacterized protein n=1 Tax=Elysia crispata TaxID=231223 RepID=A0AAE1EGI3_9GAST|nr:hypothetical protein RRG08_040745 [Elysia crispata]